jgi:glycosyltransferase involved in cell wall biosynthesis
MKKTPLVSVVIPAFNAEYFIEKTLDSVIAQTYTDYEIVVVDDGSSDNTKKVVKEYFARKQVCGQCIRQPNKKIAGARNTGIRAAQGSWIALLDHDDLWHKEKLEKVMSVLNRRPDIDLLCHNEHICKNGVVVRVTQNYRKGYTKFEELLFKGNSLSPSAVVLRKNLFEIAGGFDEDPDLNTVEDYDFWLRVSRVAKIRYLNEELGSYVLVKSAASNRILYHHRNLGIMLERHLKEYHKGRMGLLGRLRAKKKVASVYRSALVGLLAQRIEPEAQERIAKEMIKTCIWDSKNIIRYLEWKMFATTIK